MESRSIASKRPLGVCGEIAVDVYFIPLLIGLGLDSISIDIHMVDMVRKKILSLRPAACRQLTSEVLSARYAAEVRMLLSQFSGSVQKIEDKVFEDNVECVDPVCTRWLHIRKITIFGLIKKIENISFVVNDAWKNS